MAYEHSTSEVDGYVADLIRSRTGLTGIVTITEDLTSYERGCDTCGYGSAIEADVTIHVGNTEVFSSENVPYPGANVLVAINEWLQGARDDG